MSISSAHVGLGDGGGQERMANEITSDGQKVTQNHVQDACWTEEPPKLSDLKLDDANQPEPENEIGLVTTSVTAGGATADICPMHSHDALSSNSAFSSRKMIVLKRTESANEIVREAKEKPNPDSDGRLQCPVERAKEYEKARARIFGANTVPASTLQTFPQAASHDDKNDPAYVRNFVSQTVIPPPPPFPPPPSMPPPAPPPPAYQPCYPGLSSPAQLKADHFTSTKTFMATLAQSQSMQLMCTLPNGSLNASGQPIYPDHLPFEKQSGRTANCESDRNSSRSQYVSPVIGKMRTALTDYPAAPKENIVSYNSNMLAKNHVGLTPICSPVYPRERYSLATDAAHFVLDVGKEKAREYHDLAEHVESGTERQISGSLDEHRVQEHRSERPATQVISFSPLCSTIIRVEVNKSSDCLGETLPITLESDNPIAHGLHSCSGTDIDSLETKNNSSPGQEYDCEFPPL